MTDLLSISMILILIEHLPCICFTSLSVRTEAQQLVLAWQLCDVGLLRMWKLITWSQCVL